MQRKRGELVPIGEVVSGLDDVPALRDASPQARRGFTVADQVNQLVRASEADADRGFMARMMALCSLPRSNPGNRLQYKRVNGPYTLAMIAGVNNKLPFGNFPRLILAWVSTEAVQTQSRVLILGPSLAKFMRELGIYSSGGGNVHTKLRNQMRRLFNAHVQLVYKGFWCRQPTGIGDNGTWCIVKRNGILYLPDVGSKTTSFFSAFAGISASN